MTRLEDDFGEAPGLKAQARSRAKKLGHDLSNFRVRPNDAHYAEAWCKHCSLIVVIHTETGDGRLPSLYGWALDRPCKGEK